ncbi:MAG: GNAT family N-acetyltransferase [Bacteroidetes bacterium]|nr:GNAT family N-acetyltransferase [Bacteroidota bacterium]
MLHYHLKAFDQLALEELYELLKLRAEVFVVEQDCPYLDLDGQDQQGWHLLGMDDSDQLQAYVRILPPGTSYPEYASIGRVVTREETRGKGYGKTVMAEALKHCEQLFPSGTKIKISAQVYLLGFYQSLGFKEVGAGYLEDGIPHIAMLRE